MANVEVTVQLVDRMSKDMRKIEKRLDKLDRNVKDTGKSSRKAARQTGGLGSSLTKLGVIAGSVTAAVFTLKQGFDFAEQGAQLLRLEKAGATLAENFGSNMDAMVRSIQDASQGTISRMDAIRAANQAMQLGVAKTPEEFEQLTKSAVALGQAMGVGPVQAIRDITTGIGRMSPLILDNLGITTKGGAIYDDYAASIGKTTQELTDTEKKQVLLNAALDSANKLLDENGEVVLDTANAYDKLRAETSDAADRFEKEFAVAVEPVVELLADAVGGSNDLNEALALMENRIEGAHRGMFILKDGTVVSGDALIEMVEKSRESGEVMRAVKSAGLSAAEGYSAAGEAADTAGGKISDFTTEALAAPLLQEAFAEARAAGGPGGEVITQEELARLQEIGELAGKEPEGIRKMARHMNASALEGEALFNWLQSIDGMELEVDIEFKTRGLPGGGAFGAPGAGNTGATAAPLPSVPGNISEFAHGGVVPGPVGKPQPAIVHGGETVLRPEQSQISIGSVNFGGARGEMDEFQALERMFRRL